MTTETGSRLPRFERPLCYVMGSIYVVAGISHFLAPKLYEQVVPPLFPRKLDLVYLSGVAEILLGVGVMFPRTRRVSAWGLIGLLVAVFPANVYMATERIVPEAVPESMRDHADVALWVRLPLQAVLILWAWWYTEPSSDDTG
ncbi:hypothetical protein ACFQJC_06825 [Haloferax namakaokahaiae]|uniref:DoxX family membrane protein n=1 Tax=Haloferax namakaokahaiae TaxID=1748331 RepID=A0ABD5ZDG5_9EURY